MGYFVSVFSGVVRCGSAVRAALVTAMLAAGALTAAAPAAHADPSANDWARLRMCESSGNYAINTGNGYYGAYQFNIGTWEWVGGTGLPSDASSAEQDYRALKLYRINGWAPWPACTKKLGLTNDKDAKSKVIPPEPDFGPATQAQLDAEAAAAADKAAKKKAKKKAAAEKAAAEKAAADKAAEEKAAADKAAEEKAAADQAARDKAAEEQAAADKAAAKAAAKKKAAAAKKKRETPPATEVIAAEGEPDDEAEQAPEWPGRPFLPGEYSDELKIWQEQAASLGYDVVPTGYFGPKTERIARDIQGLHGISRVSTIGPETWSAAWTAP